MRVNSLVLGLVAVSITVSQPTRAQTVVARVYHGNDFSSYSLDPPYWSYHKEFWHPENAHWLYRNHHYVFFDIKLAALRVSEAVQDLHALSKLQLAIYADYCNREAQAALKAGWRGYAQDWERRGDFCLAQKNRDGH